MILTRLLHSSFRPVLRPSLSGRGSLKCPSITPASLATKASSGNKVKKSSPAASAKKVSTAAKTKKAAAVPASAPAASPAAAVQVNSSGKKKAAVPAKAPVTKRPLSAYSIFLRNEYNKVKEQSPDLKFTEISKKLGDLWKELPNDQKAKYLREAEKAQAIAKAKEGPKAPPNAYAVFAKEVYKVGWALHESRCRSVN